MQLSLDTMIAEMVSTKSIQDSAGALKTPLSALQLSPEAVDDFTARYTTRVQAASFDVIRDTYLQDEQGLRSSHANHISGLSKRVSDVMTAAIKDVSARSGKALAVRGMLSPSWLWPKGVGRTMPQSPVEHQVTRQLARTIGLSIIGPLMDAGYASGIEASGLNTPAVVNVIRKIMPALKRRILDRVEMQLMQEWTLVDLRAEAAFLTSTAGQKSLQAGVAISKEMDKARNDILAEAKAISAARR